MRNKDKIIARRKLTFFEKKGTKIVGRYFIKCLLVGYFLGWCFLPHTFAQSRKEPGKNYIKGLKGTDSLSLERVTFASILVPGYSQAYNRQYWKIPTLYAGAGAMIYGGIRSGNQYHKTGFSKYSNQRNLYFLGAGLIYLGSVIDGVYNYKTDPTKKIIPAKASFYSALFPGLGQAYNGDYWKMPVIYAGFSFLYYWYDLNQMQYKRFRRAYNAATDDDPNTVNEFDGLSPDGIKRYRDKYRRDRDYAVLYMALFYAIQIIEANVSAHLSDFDVSENLAFNLSPAVMPETMMFGNSAPAVGLTLNLTFKDKKKKWHQ